MACAAFLGHSWLTLPEIRFLGIPSIKIKADLIKSVLKGSHQNVNQNMCFEKTNFKRETSHVSILSFRLQGWTAEDFLL